ncbi:MAG: hypothetical protein ACRED9_02370 [Caulobacteraceae bacterium]
MSSPTQSASKPSYLGLLNAISLAETRAGEDLCAWAEATNDAELGCCLRLIAAREASHGALFRQRLEELGYQLRDKSDPNLNRRRARLGDPGVSDLDKLPAERGDGADTFADIERRLAEGEFDPMTANLLSWYIAEERDSDGRLKAAWAAVRARPNGGRTLSADAEAILASIDEGFSRLEKSLEKLAAQGGKTPKAYKSISSKGMAARVVRPDEPFPAPSFAHRRRRPDAVARRRGQCEGRPKRARSRSRRDGAVSGFGRGGN